MQKYELSSSSQVRPARNLQLTTSSEQKYELSSSSLPAWNRWVLLECDSELKPKPCDRNALALVNCLLNQATTSCTNDFAFVRRPFALPTASITIYAGTKESILISVFRAQNSSSSLTNTISANQRFWYDLLRPNAILPPNRALRVHGLRWELPFRAVSPLIPAITVSFWSLLRFPKKLSQKMENFPGGNFNTKTPMSLQEGQHVAYHQGYIVSDILPSRCALRYRMLRVCWLGRKSMATCNYATWRTEAFGDRVLHGVGPWSERHDFRDTDYLWEVLNLHPIRSCAV